MAKKKEQAPGLQNTSSVETRSFNKGMIKDLNDSLVPEGSYLHARNAVNNTNIGDLGIIGNEQANFLCTSAPYPIIGLIHLYGDIWAVFSTDDTNSEIGLVDESDCSYTTVVNDPCLNFNRLNPIIGVSKESFECTYKVYWADGENPDRCMDMTNPPYIQIPDPNNTDPDCNATIDGPDLDCEKMRLARLVNMPCIKISKSVSAGELQNGTYQAILAYTQNGEVVTDYSIPSNKVSLFEHSNVSGSINIEFSNLDTDYDEFELVVIGFVNNKTVAKRMGLYSTHTSSVTYDKVDADAITIPIELFPLDIPSYEKSTGIYRNGDFLIRTSPTAKLSFNYQPLANNIKTEWISAQYPQDYYKKAGVNTSYMRDEVYPFFIRFVYDTYDKTESFHIPGRAPLPSEIAPTSSVIYGPILYFEETNTGSRTGGFPTGTLTDDGGILTDRGDMAYWESSERYPDNAADVWGNLCGKPIRHHKMPDNRVINHFTEATGTTDETINVLGVQFGNIEYPKDLAGNDVPGIVGYEILRGNRDGEKSVVAKGLVSSMGNYVREDNKETAYYPNYPYNDLRLDPFLSHDWIKGDHGNSGYELGSYGHKKLTFHSPDTQFKNPFLSAKELKIYESMSGKVDGRFEYPYEHPKHKLITDTAFILSAVVGFGLALVAINGEKKTTRNSLYSVDEFPFGPIPTNVPIIGLGAAAGVTNTALAAGEKASDALGLSDLGTIFGLQGNYSAEELVKLGPDIVAASTPGIIYSRTEEFDSDGKTGLPLPLKLLQSVPSFVVFWGETVDATLKIIKGFSKYRQYALQYQSHSFHNEFDHSHSREVYKINDAAYLKDKISRFGKDTVNNLYRSSVVALDLDSSISKPSITDDSRVLMSDTAAFGRTVPEDVGVGFSGTTASAHYVGLKQRLRNQYGQIDGVKQLPTSSCMQGMDITVDFDPLHPLNFKSGFIFGGDIYINRYTEKNSLFFFTDWMHDLPDGFEYDYKLNRMFPYPTYWMDTEDFDLNDMFDGFRKKIAGWFNNPNNQGGNPPNAILPSGLHNFDRGVKVSQNQNGFIQQFAMALNLIIKEAFMYLSNSGIRDFFVESEINLGYRDWGEREEERHFDPFIDNSFNELLRMDRLKFGNFYKYDYSLSVSSFDRVFNSWGTVQTRDYDPETAESCYTLYPKRLIYSLPQHLENKKDNWRVFLINNYKDFPSPVTTIKPIGKTGAMMLLREHSPIMFQGVDTLQTEADTKITIGDAGLFNQALQNIVNSDDPYEYGSCQNRLSVINVPGGLFWISQNQGKIFNYTGQMEDVSQSGMKWWFEEFLKYKVLDDFPTFDVLDNTIVGIGCQSSYDNTNSVVYFAKRDFKLKEQYVTSGAVTYIGDGLFQLRNAIFPLGDPFLFDDASWTISYDLKTKSWISFHDWKPNLLMPSRNHFLSISGADIWRHNVRTDLYCNFYGVDYPFEIEFVNPTGQNVNTLKSIEYIMEVYIWDQNGVDKNHVLDYNFDRAIVYNTEQISGELNLILSPKNNAPLILNYPQVTPGRIDILYSKEEQKYRFNQFWDITDNRGEFSTARRMMWETEANGYIKDINPFYVNYAKPEFQRKKFRHYQSNVWLQRRVSGAHNMQLKLVNSKNQYSPR